jgi:hypothetical protein
MKTSSIRLVFAALAAISLANQAAASPVGSIAGSVKDSTGGMVPRAKLTLTNTATNAQTNSLSNANGEFQFLQLAPSTYTLVAEAPGFKKVSTSVLVEVDQITHVDVNLEVGSVSETVQVEAVAPLLENDKSTLSSVVDSTNIANLPLNGRQSMDLALITPGVVPTASGTQVFS